jgi:two-component system KDP operon response regulator KdpE
MLCGTDETELIKQVPALADLPVIFLSGYGGREPGESAFEAGATDYLVRPFSPTELVARVAAALRRGAERREPFRLGELAVDYDQRRVSVAGRPVQLTSTEYELLRELSVHSGRVLTHDTLLRRVWKSRDSGDRRLVRAIVKNLRRKLGDDANNPRFIFTQSRVGYRMARPAGRTLPA